MTLSQRLLAVAAALALATPGALGETAQAHAAPAAVTVPPAPPVTLAGRAVLPADTFAAGPPSGALISDPKRSTPFASQPVQGFSAYVDNHDGTYLAMPDNGYGSQENSADFLERVYTVTPSFNGSTGGTGAVTVKRFVTLSDPDHKMPFSIVHEFTDRQLTGADVDLESLQVAPDGTWWLGEEFGPSLLHTDTAGRLLDPPYLLPDVRNGGTPVRSRQNGGLEEAASERIMQALANRATSYPLPSGTTRKPLIVSPDQRLVADGDPTTGVATRQVSPGPGVPTSGSEVFDPAALLSAGFPTVPYTVDAQADMDRLLSLKDARNGNRPTIAGIISDDPALLYARITALRPDAVLPDGRIDRTKLDLEAHRGGRAYRPENTLGSFEYGLDNLATTLETDDAITSDGVLVLSHDPFVNATKCRHTDGTPYTAADQVDIDTLTLAQLQGQFVCDKLLGPAFPNQDNAVADSPLARDFAASRGLTSPFVVPTTQELVDFLSYYAAHTTGAQAANAAAVHLNLETKTNPRFPARTTTPDVFATKLATLIENDGLADRADVQSFDFRELLQVQAEHPDISTVYLFGDTPFNGTAAGDGTNLQPLTTGGDDSPWLAGLRWPWRVNTQTTPARDPSSGGFEGLALSPDGGKLYPVLEKATTDDPGRTRISEFDLASKSFTGNTWYYRYHVDAGATGTPGVAPGIGFSIPEVQLVPTADGHLDGVLLERDGVVGQSTTFRRVYEFALGAPGTEASSREVADLEQISDPAGLGGTATKGGVFTMPFTTIEDLLAPTPTRLLVGNDNNYPFDNGRDATQPDPNEFVELDLATPLGQLAPPAPAAVSAGDVTVSERAGTALVPVTLSVAAPQPVSVAYATADGTAKAGSDYVATSGTVVIPAGATGATVAVPIVDDTVAEPLEQFSLTLSGPSGGPATLDHATATVTVVDDDVPTVIVPPTPPGPTPPGPSPGPTPPGPSPAPSPTAVPAAPGLTRLLLSASAATVPLGTPVTYGGILVRGGRAVGGASVGVTETYRDGRSGPLGVATTAADGTWSLTTRPLYDGQVTASAGMESGTTFTGVAAVLLGTRAVAQGRRVTVTSSVAPGFVTAQGRELRVQVLLLDASGRTRVLTVVNAGQRHARPLAATGVNDVVAHVTVPAGPAPLLELRVLGSPVSTGVTSPAFRA